LLQKEAVTFIAILPLRYTNIYIVVCFFLLLLFPTESNETNLPLYQGKILRTSAQWSV